MRAVLRTDGIRLFASIGGLATALVLIGCPKSSPSVGEKVQPAAAKMTPKRPKGIGVVNCSACAHKDDEISFDLMDDDSDGLTDAVIVSVTFFGCSPQDLTFDAAGSRGSTYSEDNGCENPPCLVGYEVFTGLTEDAVDTCSSYALMVEDNVNQNAAEECSISSTPVTCP